MKGKQNDTVFSSCFTERESEDQIQKEQIENLQLSDVNSLIEEMNQIKKLEL